MYILRKYLNADDLYETVTAFTKTAILKDIITATGVKNIHIPSEFSQQAQIWNMQKGSEIFLKGTEFLPQTLIFLSPYLCNSVRILIDQIV